MSKDKKNSQQEGLVDDTFEFEPLRVILPDGREMLAEDYWKTEEYQKWKEKRNREKKEKK